MTGMIIGAAVGGQLCKTSYTDCLIFLGTAILVFIPVRSLIFAVLNVAIMIPIRFSILTRPLLLTAQRCDRSNIRLRSSAHHTVFLTSSLHDVHCYRCR